MSLPESSILFLNFQQQKKMMDIRSHDAQKKGARHPENPRSAFGKFKGALPYALAGALVNIAIVGTFALMPDEKADMLRYKIRAAMPSFVTSNVVLAGAPMAPGEGLEKEKSFTAVSVSALRREQTLKELNETKPLLETLGKDKVRANKMARNEKGAYFADVFFFEDGKEVSRSTMALGQIVTFDFKGELKAVIFAGVENGEAVFKTFSPAAFSVQ